MITQNAPNTAMSTISNTVVETGAKVDFSNFQPRNISQEDQRSRYSFTNVSQFTEYKGEYTQVTFRIDDPEITTIPRFQADHRSTYVGLVSDVKDLLRRFWAIVISKALQNQLPINKANISIFHDPNEESKQVVLRLFTSASATQSVSFWESLENDIQNWVSKLSESARNTFIENISLRIHWD